MFSEDKTPRLSKIIRLKETLVIRFPKYSSY